MRGWRGPRPAIRAWANGLQGPGCSGWEHSRHVRRDGRTPLTLWHKGSSPIAREAL